MKTGYPLVDAIGITSTIPIEIPLSAGRKIVDLNNRFILSENPGELIKIAEAQGFPRNCCAWIKGIYGLVKSGKIGKIIFVTGGDCSNTHALLETLLPDLTEVFTFSYPYPADREQIKREMLRFCEAFGTSFEAAEEVGNKLAGIRTDLRKLDLMTWEEGRVTGGENHLWLVSSSDFDGDYDCFRLRLKEFLSSAEARKPRKTGPKVGVLGVPPIFSDLHDVVESYGARVVYNEIPRQFAMIGEDTDLVSRYTDFTYPYGVWPRTVDMRAEIEKRKIDGIIHYTQSFCHRQIHDIVIRKEVGIPVLTIDGEIPGPLDQRTRLRIESFCEILTDRIVRGK